ncbi:MAG: HAD-IA family hydrolase [Alphaproteobacteria bacterium]|nr:HAD-IA family hydrolase [Alphaproteobacteria bacterium]
MDGVLTDTARLHIDAWEQLFNDFLSRRAAASGEAFVPFDTAADYLAYVDGRPREDGVRLFLASRGISLPEGSENSPEGSETVGALSRRKDGLFGHALQAGADPLPGAEPLLGGLRRLGILTAVVSSSRNCAAVLEATGLSPLVDVRVDGMDAVTLGLPGKPAPALFLEAARRLGVEPRRGILFEDAIAGVEAGRRGGFGRVVGVDIGDHAAALLRHGADVVIGGLSEVAVAAD